jgi:hypothetical protein
MDNFCAAEGAEAAMGPSAASGSQELQQLADLDVANEGSS